MAGHTCGKDVYKVGARVTGLVEDLHALYRPLEMRIVRGTDIEPISNVEDRAPGHPAHQESVGRLCHSGTTNAGTYRCMCWWKCSGESKSLCKNPWAALICFGWNLGATEGWKCL